MEEENDGKSEIEIAARQREQFCEQVKTILDNTSSEIMICLSLDERPCLQIISVEKISDNDVLKILQEAERIMVEKMANLN